MKHSKQRNTESQFIYGLDFCSKELKLSKPIWYDSIAALTEDLKFFCRAYPSESEFIIMAKRKENTNYE